MTDSIQGGHPAQEGGNTGAGDMKHAVDVTKRATAGLIADVQSEAAALGGEVKTVLGEQASHRMHSMADTIEGLSSGLADTSAKLDETWARPLVGHASEALQSVAGYIRNSNPDSIMHDAQALARERPGAVFMGSIAVGFALARAGKALVAQMPRQTSGVEGNSNS